MAGFALRGRDHSLPADNWIRAAIVLSFLFIIFYILEAIFLGIFQTFTNVNEVSFIVAPKFTIAMMSIIIILGIIINPIGLVGVWKDDRFTTVVHFYLIFPLILATMVVFVFLLMSGNGIIAASGRDVNSNTQGQDEVNINTFADETQELIVKYALDHRQAWKELQDVDLDSSQCCGFNLQAIYSAEVFGIAGFEFSQIHTGAQCSVASNTEILNLLAAFPNFTPDAIKAVEENTNNAFPVISSANFFCEEFLASAVRDRAQKFSILYGIQGFFQFVLMFLVGMLLFFFEIQYGGMKANDDPVESRPKIENTVLAKAGYTAQQLGEGPSNVPIPNNGVKQNTSTSATRGRPGVGSTKSRAAGHIKF